MKYLPPQFSLRSLLAVVTGVCVFCGAALAWTSYLRQVEIQLGHIPLGLTHLWVLLIFITLTFVFGLALAAPVWLLSAWCQTRDSRSQGLNSRASPKRSCRCAYCGSDAEKLYETDGPLGTGGIFVCHECSRACISLTS